MVLTTVRFATVKACTVTNRPCFCDLMMLTFAPAAGPGTIVSQSSSAITTELRTQVSRLQKSGSRVPRLAEHRLSARFVSEHFPGD